MRAAPKKEKKICRSCVAETSSRCTRKAPFWSPYCFQHRKSLTGRAIGFIVLIGSFLFGFATDLLKERVTEKYFMPKPIIDVWLNGFPLSEETVILDSSTNREYQLNFVLINRGDKEAKDVHFSVQVNHKMSQFLTSPFWSQLDTNDNGMVSFRRKLPILQQMERIPLKTLSFDRDKFRNFAAAVKLRAVDVSPIDMRTHIFFETHSQNMNPLTGGDAVAFLRQRFSGYEEGAVVAETSLP